MPEIRIIIYYVVHTEDVHLQHFCMKLRKTQAKVVELELAQTGRRVTRMLEDFFVGGFKINMDHLKAEILFFFHRY